MAATFNVMLDTGGTDGTPGTSTNTDPLGPPNMRFKYADNALIDSNDPIPIPPSGTKYSKWKSIYLKCTSPPNTQVNNLKFYTDGSNFGTGITVRVGQQFPTKNSGSNTGYKVATPVDTAILNNYSGITSVADAFTFTSGSPLTGPSITEASNIITASNQTTNYLILQMEVISTASPGDLADETFTLQYDEI